MLPMAAAAAKDRMKDSLTRIPKRGLCHAPGSIRHCTIKQIPSSGESGRMIVGILIMETAEGIFRGSHTSFSRMHTHGHRAISLLLLCGQLALGPLLEISHTDTLVLSGGSASSIATHDCGSQEVHDPLSVTGFCIACALSLTRHATMTSVNTGTGLICNFRITPPSDVAAIALLHIFSTSLRGPPAA